MRILHRFCHLFAKMKKIEFFPKNPSIFSKGPIFERFEQTYCFSLGNLGNFGGLGSLGNLENLGILGMVGNLCILCIFAFFAFFAFSAFFPFSTFFAFFAYFSFFAFFEFFAILAFFEFFAFFAIFAFFAFSVFLAFLAILEFLVENCHASQNCFCASSSGKHRVKKHLFERKILLSIFSIWGKILNMRLFFKPAETVLTQCYLKRLF